MKSVGSFFLKKNVMKNVKKITKVIKPLLSKLENFEFDNLKCITTKVKL